MPRSLNMMNKKNRWNRKRKNQATTRQRDIKGGLNWVRRGASFYSQNCSTSGKQIPEILVLVMVWHELMCAGVTAR